MTNNQAMSAIHIVDHVRLLKDVSCLVEIAYEQIEQAQDDREKALLRCQVLLGEFLLAMNLHIEEIEQHTKVIRTLVQ